MSYAPVARIIIRYGVGAIIGLESANILAGDVDVVAAVALAVGALTEFVYTFAKKKGWAT